MGLSRSKHCPWVHEREVCYCTETMLKAEFFNSYLSLPKKNNSGQADRLLYTLLQTVWSYKTHRHVLI